MNFVKNDTLKMRILSKSEILKGEFLDKLRILAPVCFTYLLMLIFNKHSGIDRIVISRNRLCDIQIPSRSVIATPFQHLSAVGICVEFTIRLDLSGILGDDLFANAVRNGNGSN